MDNGSLQGRVAIVTGGAGGIGSAVCAKLAHCGAHVVVADIVGDAAETVAGALRDDGLSARGCATDVSQEESVRALVSETIREFGRIDIVDNNAVESSTEVWGRDKITTDMDVQVWDAVFATNIRGPMLLCKHAIPHMIEQGEGGVILNTSSGASEVGQKDMLTAYAASKGALNSFTYYVAAQYGKYQVRCNAILLGVVLTDSLRRLMGEDAVAHLAAMSRLGKPSTPADVAEMVQFLVSDSSDTVTGQLFRL